MGDYLDKKIEGLKRTVGVIKSLSKDFENYTDTLSKLKKEKELRKTGKHLDGYWIGKVHTSVCYSEMSDDFLDDSIKYFTELAEIERINENG